jgi:hypothetical protein
MLRFHSAVLLLFLVITQVAPSVCTAQCMQHRLPMSHCGSMLPAAAHGPAIHCCPAASDLVCAIEPPANTQSTLTAPPSLESEPGPEVLPALLNVPSLTNSFSSFRSSVGDPPLITPLRV